MPTEIASQLDTVGRIIDAKKAMPGAMLPILHAIQDTIGYIPPEAVARIAGALNVSRAEVHGVVTYYHHFRQHPPGRHVVRVCRAEACQAVGADALLDHARALLGCGEHETSGDGEFTLEPVFCLGHCACGPNILLDADTLHARVTPERFDAIVQATRGQS